MEDIAFSRFNKKIFEDDLLLRFTDDDSIEWNGKKIEDVLPWLDEFNKNVNSIIGCKCYTIFENLILLYTQ